MKRPSSIAPAAARQRGSVLVFCMVLAGVGAIGTAAFFSLIQAKSMETLERETALIRRIRLANSQAVAKEALLRNHLGSGNAAAVLQCAYLDHAQDRPRLPAEDGIVPILLDRVRPVHEVVYVEHFLPGCPPPADRIKALLTQLLTGLTPHLAGSQLKFG